MTIETILGNIYLYPLPEQSKQLVGRIVKEVSFLKGK